MLQLRILLFGGVSASLRFFPFMWPRLSGCSKNWFDLPTDRLCINGFTNSMNVALVTGCSYASSVHITGSPITVGSSFPLLSDPIVPIMRDVPIFMSRVVLHFLLPIRVHNRVNVFLWGNGPLYTIRMCLYLSCSLHRLQ